MKFYKTLGMVWTGVALAFASASAPAVADDMDVLGQFLEQNFPVQNDRFFRKIEMSKLMNDHNNSKNNDKGDNSYNT